MGAEMVRPSARSTVIESLVTATDWALTILNSTVKVFIPVPKELLLVFLYKFLNPVKSPLVKSATLLKSDRIEPEFSGVFVMFNMNMGRLIAITGIKKESVRPDP